MQTRIRQIQLKKTGILTKTRAKKLNAEEDALICLINEGAKLEGQHLKDLKHKTNVSPVELDNESKNNI